MVSDVLRATKWHRRRGGPFARCASSRAASGVERSDAAQDGVRLRVPRMIRQWRRRSGVAQATLIVCGAFQNKTARARRRRTRTRAESSVERCARMTNAPANAPARKGLRSSRRAVTNGRPRPSDATRTRPRRPTNRLSNCHRLDLSDTAARRASLKDFRARPASVRQDYLSWINRAPRGDKWSATVRDVAHWRQKNSLPQAICARPCRSPPK